MRLSTCATLLLIAAIVSGCVSAKTPLYPDNQSITDSSLLGTYDIKSASKPQDSTEIKIFLHNDEYVAAMKGKLYFIGRFYPYHQDYFIAQIRGPGNIDYVYFVFRKTESGVAFNLIPCPNGPDVSCDNLKDREQLAALVDAAIGHFSEGDQAFTAEKKSDFAQ
jgi:hypothetical protein